MQVEYMSCEFESEISVFFLVHPGGVDQQSRQNAMVFKGTVPKLLPPPSLFHFLLLPRTFQRVAP